ncbi:three component ABC system middle component [Acinetobacter pittii]|uniref:three component ABC system middle component n=1 Tax=Acinetobacter pittii TaxID=48296 RepID=UPI0021CD3D42|nr:three component ABC system middle component [Acinetobacter pittii]MCU4709990.1 DUF6521 family protein [Acinetobacter pittii]
MNEFINKWQSRPPEVRTLLNPAFCGLLLYTSMKEYKKLNKKDISIPLLFLILPLILNMDLRNIITTNKNKNLIYIVNSNKNKFHSFDYIFNYYTEYTYEAIYFLYFNQYIEIAKNNFIIKSKNNKFNDDYLNKYIKDISHLIKILSKVKSDSTIYSTLGVSHES